MTLGLLTPSYAPDLGRFELLHRSVLACTDADVLHEVVVPDRDVHLFARIASDRLRVVPYRDLLPPFFVRTDWLARAAARIPGLPRGARFIAVNRRHPWPPLRGWLLQQILKLSAAGRSEADVVLLVDSDTQFIRPVREGSLVRDGRVRFYREPGAIHAGMTRHVEWHRDARTLLGLPDDGDPPYDDPIAGLIAWDPEVVRGLLHRLQETHGRAWEDTLARQWELSEYVLYGEYLSTLAPERIGEPVTRSGCVTWWGPGPLSDGDADRLFAEARADDVALVVQSTSGTGLEQSAAIGDRLRARH